MTDKSAIFWDHDLCLRASAFAARAHLDQRMLQGTHYLLHVSSVAMETAGAVARSSGRLEGDLAIPCAWLHDTVEDTDTTLDDIREAFGARIASGVSALTKNGDLPKDEAMRDSLRRLLDQPPSVRVVKVADRIVNLQSPPDSWSRAKRTRYADEGALILDTLRGTDPWLESRLEGTIATYRARHIDHD